MCRINFFCDKLWLFQLSKRIKHFHSKNWVKKQSSYQHGTLQAANTTLATQPYASSRNFNYRKNYMTYFWSISPLISVFLYILTSRYRVLESTGRNKSSFISRTHMPICIYCGNISKQLPYQRLPFLRVSRFSVRSIIIFPPKSWTRTIFDFLSLRNNDAETKAKQQRT